MEIMEQLRSELIIFYLDDGIWGGAGGGSVEDITQDLQIVEWEAEKPGPSIEPCKVRDHSHDQGQ